MAENVAAYGSPSASGRRTLCPKNERTAMIRRTILALGIAFAIGAAIHGEDSADAVRKQFKAPSKDYSSGPLWTWNDLLTESQIRESLRDLAAQQVRQVWVHPRPGLLTPYLGEDWFRMWAVTLDEAAKLDMNVWIYDENSYPSGFAGGLVPEALPDSRNVSLRAKETPKPAPIDADTVAVFHINGETFEDVTDRIRRNEAPAGGTFLTVYRVHAESSPWYAGKWYVDLLKPGVTEKFLEVTLEPYRKRFGNEFGKRIPGVFTDEPNLFVPTGLPWTDDLPQRFEERWGHPLIANLPCLFRPVGDWRHMRHHFFQCVLELFIERWAKPYHDYCAKYGMEFTGHYWEHGWPNVAHGPDSMAMYAWHQRPAIDILFNQYKEDTNGQFGNARAVRELASVANQTGVRRTLCETYGGGGWDLRLEDMKRIGDWIYVLGVNTLNEHISPVSMRGARKRDYPQFFTAHEPWWDAYHTLERYFTRLSLILSSGRQQNDILVLEPTTTSWLYQTAFDPSQKDALAKLGNSFFDLLMALERAQIPYDIGSEDILARQGSVDNGALHVGQASYTTLVIPANTENLNGKTVDLVSAFASAGGAIFSCGHPPALVDGQPSDAPSLLSQCRVWQRVEQANLPDKLVDRNRSPIRIKRAASDEGILFQHQRRLEAGDFLFLANTSIDKPSNGTISATGFQGVERWDAHTGEIAPAPFERGQDALSASFSIPPCGSTLLFFTKERKDAPSPPSEGWETMAPAGPMTARRLQPNVLTLDFVDVKANGQQLTAAYCPAASDFAFQQYGLHGNPSNKGVQFRDEWLRKELPSDSGFEATYKFRIDGEPPPRLQAVVERADMYNIQCNGRPVKPTDNAYWVDRSFNVIDISAAAIPGDNTLTISCRPLTIYHEIEPAYLLGDFRLSATESGFSVVASPAVLSDPLAKWDAVGLPLYGHDVAYTQSFQIAKPAGRYRIALPAWHGSVARVKVNGEIAGFIGWPPYQLDLCEKIRPGNNTIDVIISGTLKNTMGPHHIPGLRGIASPGHLSKGPKTGPAPGKDYDVISYGLFEPFTLSQAR